MPVWVPAYLQGKGLLGKEMAPVDADISVAPKESAHFLVERTGRMVTMTAVSVSRSDADPLPAAMKKLERALFEAASL